MDKVIYNRQTYSLLDWLGDCGGLFDALYYFLKVIVTPVASFNLQATLLSYLIRERPSDSESKQTKDQSKKKDNFISNYFSNDNFAA